MVEMEYLRRTPLLGGLPEAFLARIAAMAVEQRYGPGQYIFREGEESTHLYVITDGRVALEMNLVIGRREVGERRAFAVVLGPADCFSWSALVPPHILTMSAVAMQATTVLAIDGAALRRLIQEEPRSGIVLLRGLAEIVSSRLIEARAKLCAIIALVSHELKAPLAAVESYLQVMLGGYAGEVPAQQQEMLARCSVRVQELIALIDALLRVSRIETGDLSPEIAPTDLATLIDEAVENVAPAARDKGVRLQVRVPDGLPPLPVAPLRIQEALTNLLDNAVKFTPAGGSVDVAVTDAGDRVQVEVRDTGIGIPADEQPRIFDEFYRGRMAQARGLGLGLSLVKRIVEAHGGRIWVESPPAGARSGSAFSFILPRAREQARPGTAVAWTIEAA
ncbi:MAG: HAMP domain-containing histidine kinase [Armatimonadetes bacterium]|nr:HAMP domain-containing histidine kinase [Armatimonadota bacterium]